MKGLRAAGLVVLAAAFAWAPAAGAVTFNPAPGSPYPVPPSGNGRPGSVAVGDFNGDNKMDLAVTSSADCGLNCVAGYVSVLLADSGGGFSAASGSPIAVGHGGGSVAVGDFNGDHKLDLAVTNTTGDTTGDNTVSILLGKGDGTFTAASGSPITVGSGPRAIAVGDFNGDHKLDLAVANTGNDNTVSILMGKGDGTFTAASGSPISIGNTPQSIAVGDFNGDDKADLAVLNGNCYGGYVSVLLGNGDGTFTSATGSPVTVGSCPSSVATGDFNGDGRLDLTVSNYGDNDVSVLLGDGSGRFNAAAGSPFTVGRGPHSLAVDNFNGKPDIAVVGDGGLSMLLGNGSGGFTAGQGSPGFVTLSANPTSTGNGVTDTVTFTGISSGVSVAATDFNGDGHPDLAVVAAPNNIQQYVSVLLSASPLVALTCQTVCSVTETLTTTVTTKAGQHVALSPASAKGKRRTVVVGAKGVTIQVNTTVRVTVKLNAKGRKLLKRLAKLRVILTVVINEKGHRVTVAKRKLTVKPKKKHDKH